MRKLLLSSIVLVAVLLSPSRSHAQYVVVGQACGAGGLSAIANDGTPVVCRGNPQVWTAVGGGGGGGGINSQNGPGPVFNVKGYGAVGNMQTSFNGTINGSTITCSDCNFSQTDVGKPSFFAFGAAFNTLWSNVPISSVTNATTASIAPTSFSAQAGVLSWGTIDDTAVSNAVTAFLAQVKQQSQGGVLGIATAAPTLYFPAGNYGLLNTAIFLNPATAGAGLTIRGDGAYQSRITALTGYTPTRVLVISNISYVTVQGLTFEGMNGPAASGNNVIDTAGGNSSFNDVTIHGFAGTGLNVAAANLSLFNVSISGNLGTGFRCQPCNGEVRSSYFSGNNGPGGNITIGNSAAEPGGFGLKMVFNAIDECGTGATPACIIVTNSQDVWFVGGSYFGTPNGAAIQVDGKSYVHLNGGLAGVFAQDTNTSGLSILSGGIVEASDVRFVSTGTGKCVNNAGTFINNGANSCESMFQTITAASSSSTTATLTVTTQGANVNASCAVGDTVFVQNVTVAGYNGYFKNAVTAVGTNTLSYTTPGSNLGASSGGSVFCKGLATFTGTPPQQTLAPSQFNCNIPVLTATTTTATTNCFFTPDRDIYLDRFSAGMGTAPVTCSPNAILQVSNGTNTQNLTISAAQNDTGAIATPVLLKKNTLIGAIVQTAAAGCGTSPANAAVNMFWHAGLDNN